MHDKQKIDQKNG